MDFIIVRDRNNCRHDLFFQPIRTAPLPPNFKVETKSGDAKKKVFALITINIAIGGEGGMPDLEE